MPISTRSKIEAWRKYRYSAAFAQCKNGIGGLRPEHVDIMQVGHHSSVVFRRGTRVYSFATVEGRDKFVELYAQFGAEPCEDPHP